MMLCNPPRPTCALPREKSEQCYNRCNMGISRRGFLQAATASAAAPMLFLPGRAATLGSGAHVYEFEPDWGKLPNGKQYGYTHGVVIDSQQRILIHNRSKDAIAIFDNDSNFVKSWGEKF